MNPVRKKDPSDRKACPRENGDGNRLLVPAAEPDRINPMRKTTSYQTGKHLSVIPPQAGIR
jgi:hypothetical protein